jgi:hypothetical protein
VSVTSPAGRSNALAGSFPKETSMTKIALTALKAFPYAGKRLKAGQEFMARGVSDARVLIAIKNADFAPAMQHDPEPEPLSAAPAVDVELPIAAAAPIEAEQATSAAADTPSADTAEQQPAEPEQPAADQAAEASTEPAAETPKPRRRYQRRDMTAEGSEG